MHYIAVDWIHDFAGDPILLYSELNEHRWEVRKVEIYRNGKMDFADSSRQTGSTRLGLVPVPNKNEIAADPQFRVREINQDEFERVWQAAMRSGHTNESD